MNDIITAFVCIIAFGFGVIQSYLFVNLCESAECHQKNK